MAQGRNPGNTGGTPGWSWGVMAKAHWLGSVWQIRLEPGEYRTSDAETGSKTVDEGDMIDGVKGCTKVQRHKQGRGTNVWRTVNVV